MNQTTITFTLGEMLTWLLLIAAIIAVIILIVVLVRAAASMKSLTSTLEKTNVLLDDVDAIVKDAKDISTDAKRAVRQTRHTVNNLAKIVDTNKGSFTAVSNLASAGASLLNLFGLKK